MNIAVKYSHNFEHYSEKSTDSSISLLQLSPREAKEFLLKDSSYCNFDLPTYISFKELIGEVADILENKELKHCLSGSPRSADMENLNYSIFNNKDGKFAWRRLELVHPFYYVDLVNSITDDANWNTISNRFRAFAADKRISCLSIPRQSNTAETDTAELVSHWQNKVEAASIELSMEFSHLLHTDIDNCYGSIYCHSIPWAIHTKETAKERRQDRSLIGNQVDYLVRQTRSGQTNGIPQGSVLCDFIAEMVLGDADLRLSERIDNEQVRDFKILRFRDDYRIFAKSSFDANLLCKLLSEVLSEVGLKLNSNKTVLSSEVVTDAIKPDKWHLILHPARRKSWHERLFVLHRFSKIHPNSGGLAKEMQKFYEDIIQSHVDENIKMMIAVVCDIAVNNPKTYPITMALMSFLLEKMTNADVEDVLSKLLQRFKQIPNTGFLQIWLQRAALNHVCHDYSEKICRIVMGENEVLWNSAILKKEFRPLLNSSKLIDKANLSDAPAIISPKEVALFRSVHYLS